MWSVKGDLVSPHLPLYPLCSASAHSCSLPKSLGPCFQKGHSNPSGDSFSQWALSPPLSTSCLFPHWPAEPSRAQLYHGHSLLQTLQKDKSPHSLWPQGTSCPAYSHLSQFSPTIHRIGIFSKGSLSSEAFPGHRRFDPPLLPQQVVLLLSFILLLRAAILTD